MIPVLIFLICAFLWCFPVYRSQGKVGRMRGRHVFFSILIGAIPCMILILAVQVLLGWWLQVTPLSPVVQRLVDSFVSAALVEEAIKFLGALLMVKIAKPKRGIDYVLLFGGVGLGYELTESLMSLDSPLSGILRGVFAYHILWQFWMGLYFWRMRQAAPGKRLGYGLLAFGVPVLLHGINDFACFMGEDALAAAQTETDLESAVVWMLVFLIVVLLCTAFDIVTEVKCVRRGKADRKEAEAKMQNEDENTEDQQPALRQ